MGYQGAKQHVRKKAHNKIKEKAFFQLIEKYLINK